MTIKEYRNKLSEEIDKLVSNNGDGLIPKERIKGLQIAYDLSEKLYDTYVSKTSKEKVNYMTNRQLSELLSKWYGQVKIIDEEAKDYFIYETAWNYFKDENGGDDGLVPENVRIRKWGSSVWTKPTTDIYENYIEVFSYLFLQTNTSSDSKKEVIY